MLHEASLPSLVASAVYAVVVAACALAYRASPKKGERRWHAAAWAVLCCLFLLLAASRVTGAEEWLRDTIRTWARAEDLYVARREFQRPMAAFLVAPAAAVAATWFYFTVRARQRVRSFSVMIAGGAMGAMILLVLLRLVSLSPIDRLLYGLKLNWVVDIGATLTVLGAAVFYVRRSPS